MEQSIRNKILCSLQNRNRQQCDAFKVLIHSHTQLFEAAAAQKAKNVQLSVDVEKLKEENLELKVKLETGGGNSSGEKSADMGILEKTVYKLKDELTELYRKKGENAQQVIDMKNLLAEKEKEVQAKDAKISELEATVEGLQVANKNLEQSVMELSTTNQMLTDEQQALQLAYIGLEEKFRKMQEENNELVARWMEWKAKIADNLNAENEDFIKAKREKMEKELVDAAAEQKEVVECKSRQPLSALVNFSVSVPSRSMQKLEAHEGEVNAIRWGPSGKRFASGGSDRKLKLWEVQHAKCECKGTLMGSNAAVMSVEFDDEENYVLAASNDFASRVWSVSDQRLRHTLTGHSGKVLAAKFLGDPQKVVSGSHDRTLKIWDLRSRSCIKTIFTGSKCNDLVIVDSNNIISGHYDKKVRFTDTRSDSNSKEITFPDRITALDMSPDRTTLLCYCRDDSIMLVDLRRNQVCATLGADGFHAGADWTRAVFSPDGTFVLAGSSDGALYVWNIAKNKVENVLRDHNHAVMACSWNPMGNSLLSCDKHKTVVYWADF